MSVIVTDRGSKSVVFGNQVNEATVATEKVATEAEAPRKRGKKPKADNTEE